MTLEELKAQSAELKVRLAEEVKEQLAKAVVDLENTKTGKFQEERIGKAVKLQFQLDSLLGIGAPAK